MTLDEAIKHAEEVAQTQGCEGCCAEDHSQLAGWLHELKGFREIFGELPDYSKLQSIQDGGSVFQVTITSSDGEAQAVLLKEANVWQDRPEEIDPATGILRKVSKRSFVLAGVLVEGR